MIEEPAPFDPIPRPANPDAVRYEVGFEGRDQRRLSVRALYPVKDRSSVELAMPVWIPGSYLLREFSRNAESLVARAPDGAPLEMVKTAKNRVRVRADGRASIVLEYLLYAHELTVRTSFVDRDRAVVNPAATFFQDMGRTEAPVEMHLDLPGGWEVAVALPHVGTATGAAFAATDFDELVDSPLIAGANLVDDPISFEGADVHLVHLGDLRPFPRTRAQQDVARLVKAQASFWRTLPFNRYLFLNVIDNAGGGLEHKASTLLLFPPSRLKGLDGWRSWLGLASHELFHAWNGKRLRPAVLGPFDLEREAYTESLWIVEGLTSYYDDLILRRAGLHNDKSYLAELSKVAESVARTPGEEVQSLARSSFDAWIEFYRPDPESRNQGISYYRKGALVGLALDAEIREVTGDRLSLDDVMRAAWKDYSGARGYGDDDFYDVLEAVGGAGVRARAEALARTPERIDIEPTLRRLGLRFAESKASPKDDPLARADWAGRRSDLGWTGSLKEGRWVVGEVLRGGPAWSGGIFPGDEVLAIDGDRLPADGPTPLLRRHPPESVIEVLVARRGRVQVRTVRVGVRPEKLEIVIDERASPETERRRSAWLLGL
ncbi:MAG: hypothetical protein AAFZ18_25540 [Myxococcota bacterium]